MKYITFNNYKFYYDSKYLTHIINDDSLTFFGSESEYEVKIHISIYQEKLLFRPRYGVTFQKVDNNIYLIIAN